MKSVSRLSGSTGKPQDFMTENVKKKQAKVFWQVVTIKK